MATFSIDNDRVTAGIQDLTYDQTSGVQTPPDGDEVNVSLSSGELLGLGSDFEAYLTGLASLLTADMKNYAVANDAASSSSTFIQVTADPGETLNDLKLVADSSVALTGFKTLDGASIYVHVDSSGNYATLWTSSDNSGRIVGALALTDEIIDNTTTHTATAGIKMVFFEAIEQTDTTSQDESISLSDVLKVAVDTAVSFNFEQLAAGNFLWAAVGDGDSAMLITGQDLNVKDTGSAAQIGNIEKGGTDPSDAVNTSKATNTTIGINAQHFAPTNTGDGPTGLFTFVTGMAPLELATPVYTGGNVKQIDYDDYLNLSDATIFISQLTGGSEAIIHFSLWEAGGGGAIDKAPGDLDPEVGYNSDPDNKFSYIGNQDNDSNLRDDTPVNVASVEIDGFIWNYNDASNGTTQGGVTVTINGNDVTVDGATAGDAIKLIALDDPGSTVDGTFNRIGIQALTGSAAFDIGHVDLTQGGLTSADLGNHLFADDDGPSIDPSDDATQPNDLEVANKKSSDDATGHDSSFYYLDAGTDGLDSFIIVGPEDDEGDFQWTYDDSTNMAITGTYNGSDLYTLVLNADGTYDFDMIGTLPGSTLDLSPAEVIKAGSPDSPILEIGAVQNDSYVQMTGGGGNINESHGFVGVSNGNLDANESLTFKLFDGDDNQLTFEGIQIGTKSAQGGTYDWTATIVGGGTVSGTEIVGKNGVIDVDSTDLGDATIDSITITKVSGPATKIGVSDIHIIVQPDDVQLGFTVELKDGDDDPVTASFVVDIDGNNDGNFDATVNSLSILNSDSLEFSASASLFDMDQVLRHDTHALF